MVWRPWCRPRTEARARRQDDHSRGLTPDGPLRKWVSWLGFRYTGCSVRGRGRAWCVTAADRASIAGVPASPSAALAVAHAHRRPHLTTAGATCNAATFRRCRREGDQGRRVVRILAINGTTLL